MGCGEGAHSGIGVADKLEKIAHSRGRKFAGRSTITSAGGGGRRAAVPADPVASISQFSLHLLDMIEQLPSPIWQLGCLFCELAFCARNFPRLAHANTISTAPNEASPAR